MKQILRFVMPVLAIIFAAYLLKILHGHVDILLHERALIAFLIAFPLPALLGFLVGKKRGSVSATLASYLSFSVVVYTILILILAP